MSGPVYATNPDEDELDEEAYLRAEIEDIQEPIDFGLVYALHTFIANLEGQVCVLKGDSLELLDDSNSYWWLVKCLKTHEIGYIPAENIETPSERLARLNKFKNVGVSAIHEEDMRPITPVPPGSRRNIVFPENFVEYIYCTDDESSEGSSEDEEPPAADTLQRQKPNTASLSRNFLSKLLSRSKKAKDSVSSSSTRSSTRSLERPTLDKAFEQPQTAKDPINVLRIYAGNVDLKATFKSVALTPTLTAKELLVTALKRFRVPGVTPDEYYVSVLHMDAQERRLGENDKVYDVLEELRHKNLPGVGDSASVSKVVNSSEGKSSVRLTDDNIIKVLINKKLNLFEKNYHLIRIFMYDNSDPTGQMRTYKTLGVNSNTTVGEMTEVAIKKFKLTPHPQYRYTLSSIFENQETEREEAEKLYPILMSAQGSTEEIDFLLRRVWIGYGPAPTQPTEPAEEASEARDEANIQNILTSKPAFLKEAPAAVEHADSGMLRDMQLGSSYSSDTMDSDISRTQSMSDIVNSAMHSRQTSQNDLRPGHSHGDGDGASANRVQPQRVGASHRGNFSQPSAAVAPDSVPTPAVTSRKSSLHHDPNSVPSSQQGLDKPLPIPANRGSDSNGPQNLSKLPPPRDNVDPRPHNEYRNGPHLSAVQHRSAVSSVTSPLSDGASPDSETSTKTNIETMEQYLEEIIRGGADVGKLRALEQKMKSGLHAPPDPNSLPIPSPQGKYDDSGLEQILRRRTSSGGAAIRQPSVPRRGSSHAANIMSVYDDMAAELDESIKRTSRTSESESAGSPKTLPDSHNNSDRKGKGGMSPAKVSGHSPSSTTAPNGQHTHSPDRPLPESPALSHLIPKSGQNTASWPFEVKKDDATKPRSSTPQNGTATPPTNGATTGAQPGNAEVAAMFDAMQQEVEAMARTPTST